MRTGINRNEFKYAHDGALCCDLKDTECDDFDCRCCQTHNISESNLHTAEMELLVPRISCTHECITYLRNDSNTIAKFNSVCDIVKMFHRCSFASIPYSPNAMYTLYPLFFKLKAYLSLGVPKKLYGNGEDAPLISVFKDGSVYLISPTSNIKGDVCW